MDHILYHIFKITLNISWKHGEKTNNPLIRIYVNKIENRVTFRINTEYYLKLLTHITMKVFGITKSKITKDTTINEHGKEIPKEGYLSPEERQKIIDLRLIEYYNNGTSKSNKFVR